MKTVNQKLSTESITNINKKNEKNDKDISNKLVYNSAKYESITNSNNNNPNNVNNANFSVSATLSNDNKDNPSNINKINNSYSSENIRLAIKTKVKSTKGNYDKENNSNNYMSNDLTLTNSEKNKLNLDFNSIDIHDLILEDKNNANNNIDNVDISSEQDQVHDELGQSANTDRIINNNYLKSEPEKQKQDTNPTKTESNKDNNKLKDLNPYNIDKDKTEAVNLNTAEQLPKNNYWKQNDDLSSTIKHVKPSINRIQSQEQEDEQDNEQDNERNLNQLEHEESDRQIQPDKTNKTNKKTNKKIEKKDTKSKISTHSTHSIINANVNFSNNTNANNINDNLLNQILDEIKKLKQDNDKIQKQNLEHEKTINRFSAKCLELDKIEKIEKLEKKNKNATKPLHENQTLDLIQEEVKRIKNDKLVHDKLIRGMKEEINTLRTENKNLLNLIDIVKQKEVNDSMKMKELIKRVEKLEKAEKVESSIGKNNCYVGLDQSSVSNSINMHCVATSNKINSNDEEINEFEKISNEIREIRDNKENKILKETKDDQQTKENNQSQSQNTKEKAGKGTDFDNEINTDQNTDIQTNTNNTNNIILKSKNINQELQKSKMSIYDKIYDFVDDVTDTDTNFDMVFQDKYHSKSQIPNFKLLKQEITNDRKIIRLYESGKKELIFPSGVRKEIFPDSYQVVYFTNNDIKQVR